ncbi:MAG: outer membrane beta-barrel protein [Halioglobus sp.]|nr:outer membrane beta-barrel protein [Halioglobus sp.]
MKYYLIGLTALTLALPLQALAELPDEPSLVQGSLGIMSINDQNAEWGDISQRGVDVDFANLFVIGAEWEYPFHTGWVHWGISPGGSIGWQGDDTTFSGGFADAEGTTLNIELDNSLLIVELHLGGFVRGRLTDRITTYAAAGPALVYAQHKTESERVTRSPEPWPAGAEVVGDEDASALDFGLYARAGIDFEVRQGEHMGFSVRYSASELDFDDTIGTIDVEGTQVLFTYSTRY